MREARYSDEALAAAVAESHSWRGVLRALGISATSAGLARSVRRNADRLGLSYDHFTGQRRWSNADLEKAVQTSRSWSQVARSLGLIAEGGTLTSLRAHSHRLELETAHIDRRKQPRPTMPLTELQHRPEFLRDAGPLFAATWFTLRGAKIA